MMSALKLTTIPKEKLDLMRRFLSLVPKEARHMDTDPRHPQKGMFFLRESGGRSVVAEVYGAPAAHLLANSVAWMEALLDENEQLKEQLKKGEM